MSGSTFENNFGVAATLLRQQGVNLETFREDDFGVILAKEAPGAFTKEELALAITKLLNLAGIEATFDGHRIVYLDKLGPSDININPYGD